MKKSVNKIVFVLLLGICMCGITIKAFAATEYVDGYLRYTVADGSVTITGYNGRESEVTVPSKIAGVPVNTIAAGAFSNASTVTKVNLPDTIMTIEEGAFTVGQTVVYNSNTSEVLQPSSMDKVETMVSESDKIGSVEEVDVNFDDDLENATTESSKEADEMSVADETDTKESNNKVLLIVAGIVFLAVALAGICIYRKKGRR